MTETTGTFRYKGHAISVGHPAKVLASPGKRDGFEALIRRIHIKDNRIVGIDVYDPKKGHLRTLAPSRVQPYLRNIDKKKAGLK
jgi:hypothetical protein